jgi:hypothetical protein
MKIKLWSDLHLEFADHKWDHLWTPSPEDKEVTLVLAGDIDMGISAQEWMDELCASFKHVIRICGNHEFWFNDHDAVIRAWRLYEQDGAKNFHFLQNDWRIIDGVSAAHRIMNDYARIKINDKFITPDFILSQHELFIEFLIRKFDEPFDGKTVVVSHHSPGNALRRRGRHGDRVESAYWANLEHMIGYHNKANLWLHGHTHQNWDYVINETRVVCNPFGYYQDTENGGFDKDLIIEI